MTSSNMTTTATRRAFLGLTFAAAVGMQCTSAVSTPATRGAHAELIVQPVSTVVATELTPSSTDGLARTRPLDFVRFCLENYRRKVRDYSCTFIKQERLGSKITPEQVTEVLFREQPVFSVNMKWTQNADAAQHVLYIKNRWEDDKGNDEAYVVAAGLAKLIGKIRQPIDGPLARKASRRSIADFGFGNTLDMILSYSERAAKTDELDLRFIGETTVDGRPAYAFERRLPYTGENCSYPDRLLKFSIDKEWLVPTAVFSYCDDAGQILLGKYIHENLAMNPGLPDSDFELSALDR
ncbi:MAG TPA: DUF1571 domain-containing protein [Phycisphaerae bacterium]